MKRARIFRGIVYVTVVLLCLFMFGFALLGYRLMVVQSSSMLPTMPKGTALVLSTNSTHPKTGDVITYTNEDGTLITHRVMGQDSKGSYVTQGDNNPSPDPYPVKQEYVTGTVVAYFPGLGIYPPWLIIVLVIVFVAGAEILVYAAKPEKKEPPYWLKGTNIPLRRNRGR